MSEEVEDFNEFGEEYVREEEIREDFMEEQAGESELEENDNNEEDEIFFENIEEETKVTEEEEKVVEQGEDYSRWALDVASSRSTATADLVQPIERSPLRTEPAYRTVVDIIRRILEDLVSRGRENVLSYFDEYVIRLELELKETFGLPQQIFLQTAYAYENALRSHFINWKDAIEEYLHEFGTDNDFIEVAEMAAFELGYEIGGEDEAEPDKYNIPPDDFEEGGYKHFQDRKLEAKEPEYDEFAYVTLEQLGFAEEAGVGLTRQEHFEIHMALQRLEKVRRLISVKFWGKIFGVYQDYYIAEAEMNVEDMKIEDIEEVPEYPESEMVGEYDEEFAVEEEQRAVGEEMSEGEWEKIQMEYAEMYGEGYGEHFSEIQLKEKSKPVLEVQESVPQFEEKQEEEAAAPEEESEFEVEVSDRKFLGKQALKTYKLPPLPVIKEKPPKLPPIEDPGQGTNKHVFFVTNDPKSDWIRLPHVTPDQITTARQIRKFFTGFLSARVISYPKFPGIEIHLLRAQIARISAGTQVSPAGYFRFDDGEEAAEDMAAGKDNKVLLNGEYEPLTIQNLTDPTCTFWVHHTDYILNQGRTVWYNVDKKEPKKLGEEEEEMMDEDEGEEAPLGEEVQGERGPPILTSCAEDLFLEEIPPWTVRPAIELAPVQGCVYVRSNLWPGSLSWTFGRKIGFIYVGWGVKAVSYGYTPPPAYPPRQEYPEGPNIKEKLDPTPAEEEEFRKKIEEWQQRFKKPLDKGEGEGEGEGDDDEEEEEEEE